MYIYIYTCFYIRSVMCMIGFLLVCLLIFLNTPGSFSREFLLSFYMVLRQQFKLILLDSIVYDVALPHCVVFSDIQVCYIVRLCNTLHSNMFMISTTQRTSLGTSLQLQRVSSAVALCEMHQRYSKIHVRKVSRFYRHKTRVTE